MRRCPSCGANVVDTRVVCEKCGQDVPPPTGGGAVYGRGGIALLKTRLGIRFAAIAVGLAVFGVSVALGIDKRIVLGAVLGIVVIAAGYVMVEMFRSK